MITAFYIIVLIFSVIVHEICHGYIALALGDDTAKRAGRLTLNPLAHIDPFGSILFPLILAISGAPIFGWAKPVPYDPRFLKNPKRASGLIALAGPASNMLLAIIFALFIRLLVVVPAFSVSAELYLFFYIIVKVNIALALFNLLPIPPLDGSGVLFSVLPPYLRSLQEPLERYGFILLIVLVMSGTSFLGPLMVSVERFLLGSAAPFL